MATNDVIYPIFEKHTIGIGTRLLGKMGYTRRWFGTNGQGIVVPIFPKTQTTRVILGYNGSTSSFDDTRKAFFVARGIQIEEKPVDECVAGLIAYDVPKIDNVVVNVTTPNMQGCSDPFDEPEPELASCVPLEHKFVPYIHPH